MNIGDKVKILECHKVPELVGQEAEVIALVDPSLTKYPVAVKLLTGEHAGKPCEFREDELQPLPKGDEGIPPEILESYNGDPKKD